MCNNEKKDIIAAIITDLTARNKRSEIMSELQLSRFNNEMVRLNNEQKARLTAYDSSLTYTDCDCEYCKAKEREKNIATDNLQQAKAIRKLEDDYAVLLQQNITSSEAIASLADISSKLISQIALIEDKYNIIDTIKEDK